MSVELNHTIVPAHDPQASAQFLADILGQVYTNANGRRGTYFRDQNGHLMEILTPVSA